MCFMILGFDILIDKKFKPWLIEVNQSPSFACDSALDYKIKKNVIADAFALLNVDPERRKKIVEQKQKKMQERILTGKQQKIDLNVKEQLRQQKLKERFAYEEKQLKKQSVSGYELIYPGPNSELNAKYELYIKKAQDLWDDFTTGKKKQNTQSAQKPVKGKKFGSNRF